jgi:hypothetical protein
LRKLCVGIGRALYLAQAEPRAGLSIVTEFFVWGVGWMVWGQWGRAALMLFFLSLWFITFFLAQPLFLSIFAFFPPILPLMSLFSTLILFAIYLGIGLRSAHVLMEYIENNLVNPVKANI